MKHLKTFNSFKINEDYGKNVSKAISIYKQQLDQEKLAKIKNLAAMLNLDIQEGSIYVESQYEDYEGWEKTLDQLRDLLNEIDVDTIYYCYDTDEVTTTNPENRSNNDDDDDEEIVDDFSDWTEIESSDVKKALIGAVSEYI
jgi:hypothetical protein